MAFYCIQVSSFPVSSSTNIFELTLFLVEITTSNVEKQTCLQGPIVIYMTTIRVR